MFRIILVSFLSGFIFSASAARLEPYSPDAAVSYARTWALSRNSAYPNLDAQTSQGGDCTNFVSQVLRAGGWRNTATTNKTSDTYWWLTSTTNYSQTWSTAHGFFRHMNGGVNPPGTGVSNETWIKWNGVTSVNYGDIISVDWTGDNMIDHSIVVTGFKRKTDGTIEPRFSYHSSNRKDLPLSEFMMLPGVNPSTVKFYRFGPQNFCAVPQAYQIF